MKLNEFMAVTKNISEILDSDDVDIVVIDEDNGKDGIKEFNLKYRHVNNIEFDREYKMIQIYCHDFNNAN